MKKIIGIKNSSQIKEQVGETLIELPHHMLGRHPWYSDKRFLACSKHNGIRHCRLLRINNRREFVIVGLLGWKDGKHWGDKIETKSGLDATAGIYTWLSEPVYPRAVLNRCSW